MMGATFAPKGWAFCDGQLLPINQYQLLFKVIGTIYGGDGVTTFALPDLRGRTPIHAQTGDVDHELGDKGGSEAVVLTEAQLPSHNHSFVAADATGTTGDPTGKTLGNVSTGVNIYGENSDLQAMADNAVGNTGESLPHKNMQPSLVVNFVISLMGVEPQRP